MLERRTIFISGLAMLVALVAALVAHVLVRLIWLVTNVAFYGRLSLEPSTPFDNHLGLGVLIVPALGGVLVGLMARYGSKAIRGHGIPEAMEQILTNESRIPARMTFLKPVSAAIAIGTGGPFGAEGPIIATGGALGSLLGQVLHTTATERKTLLAAGAAAGMAATFGSPVSAVLLAVELLLFEFRLQTMLPVALASASAAACRLALDGSAPMFPIANLAAPSGSAIAIYVVIGALMGLVAVAVTWAVYAVEDAFEHLPLHWMWWPALGGLAVGAVGYVAPRTLGVGYINITDVVSDRLPLIVVATLCGMKFVSWVISLGSGTSGGTLAPLFTIGSGVGALLGAAANSLWSGAVDVRVAALVGMAALFAGASRALLASVVFAFETTHEPFGLLPLLGGCAAAVLVASLLSSTTIMTEKIVRRGVVVPSDFVPDAAAQIGVSSLMSAAVVTLRSDQRVADARDWLTASGKPHHGYPVLSPEGTLLGLVTRHQLTDANTSPEATVRNLVARAPISVSSDASLRDALETMASHAVGRLLVVDAQKPAELVGILTRSDLVRGHAAPPPKVLSLVRPSA